MKTQTIVLSIFSIFLAFNSNAQTLYVPSGAGGIGSSTNTNVGIGIASPQAPLDVLDNIRISGSAPSTGYLSFVRGTTAYTGYIEWLRPSGLRTAYIGFDNDNNLGIHLENSANFTVTGGKVGINTFSPNAMLNVKNGSVLFDGAIGPIPATGAGTRMMWYAAKGAFRVGSTWGNAWDDVYIGMNSFAAGFTTVASGEASFAFGYAAIASGARSVAFGYGATAQSYNSFVLGSYNYNPGNYDPSTWKLTDPLFVIGNGTSSSTTSNAVTVLKNSNVIIGANTAPPGIQLYVENTDKIGFCSKTIHTTDYGYNVKVISNRARAKAIAVQDHLGADQFIVWGDGYVHAREFKVTLGAYTHPDYVFEKGYDLMPLNKLQQYITKHKHFPDMFSASEVKEQGGLPLGDMQERLLKIQEHQILYTFELNDKIAALEKQNAKKDKAIEELIKRIETLEKSK